MQNWEYKIVNMKPKGILDRQLLEDHEEDLNELGREGWELVTMAVLIDGGSATMIFKRPISAKG